MKPTTILLPEDLKRWIKVRAVMDETSLAEVIRRAVEHYRDHRLDDDPFAKHIDKVYGRRAPRERSEPASKRRAARSKK